MVKIRILGGGREVGRMGLVIESRKTNVLLDYGISIGGEIPEFPLSYPPKKIDAIFLTHAHLDHSGAIPLMYISERIPFYTNKLTLELSELLIRDFLKISGYYSPYEILELRSMLSCFKPIDYGKTMKFNDIKVRFEDAGHIPGSSSISLKLEDYNILYTSDFNLIESCLLSPAKINVKDFDLIITEATYADFSHPDRKKVEKKFIESVKEVVENDGTVLVPAFAVGRSQEIICILEKYRLDYPIFMDGMAIKVSNIFLKYKQFLKKKCLFEKAYKKVHIIDSWKKRRKAIKTPGVIVSPAGMLKGGSSVFYAKKIVKNKKNGIYMVSYQGENTPGRTILTDGIFEYENKSIAVKARLEWFDFSSHSGRKELIDFIDKISSNTKIIIVHSEKESGERFKNFLIKKYGLETYFPETGEVLTL